MNEEEADVEVTMPEDAATIEYTTEETQNYVTVGTLQSIVNKASDLITTRYHYKDACSQVSAKEFDKLDITIPFTTSKVVFTYKGCISLGIDLSKVTYDIDNENMVITVSLPDPGVIANEIDDTSFEIVDESESPFNPQQLDDYATLMAELKEEKKTEVLDDAELMAEVETNTREVISDFITSSSEAADYTVEFE